VVGGRATNGDVTIFGAADGKVTTNPH